jgi:hypothetical protein
MINNNDINNNYNLPPPTFCTRLHSVHGVNEHLDIPNIHTTASQKLGKVFELDNSQIKILSDIFWNKPNDMINQTCNSFKNKRIVENYINMYLNISKRLNYPYSNYCDNYLNYIKFKIVADTFDDELPDEFLQSFCMNGIE